MISHRKRNIETGLKLLYFLFSIGILILSCSLSNLAQFVITPTKNETAIFISIPTASASEIHQPSPTSDGEINVTPTVENTPTIVLSPTLPPLSSPTSISAMPLAFLSQGDIWIVDAPGQAPRQLTQAMGLHSFTWSKDGKALASYTGSSLCMVDLDSGALNNCLDLGLTESQSAIERKITWSSDKNIIVLFNLVNPWDEGEFGWIIVFLNGLHEIIRIEDPGDWGAELAPNNDPGGFTGQPVFLNDNRLIGTLTHRWLCENDGCHYKLFEFDLDEFIFIPFDNQPENGWSEGRNLRHSEDGERLMNFGSFTSGCDEYSSFLDFYQFSTNERQVFSFPQLIINDLILFPGDPRAIITRTSSCPNQDQNNWAYMCGLTQGDEVLPMQTWDFTTNQLIDLVPGVDPNLSPEIQWLAFRSCLLPDSNGKWSPADNFSPLIYLLNMDMGAIINISEGWMPSWKP